jgi:(R,R)-butanediol dehydrogenase / meso-butanediol dehydrogenase / diacetyl reductase
MKALVFEGPGSMKVHDVPEPQITADQVLVRPLVTGICLTDVASYNGLFPRPATEPDGYPNELPGLIIGHETCAEIVEVGKGVNGWKVGQRVAVEPTVFCQQCEMCEAGLYELCTTFNSPKQSLGINSQHPDGTPHLHGAMAELCAVPQEMLYSVTSGLSDAAGASIEVLALCYTRLRASGIGVGDQVVVLGAGFDSYLLAQLADLAASNVVIVDPFEVRRTVASARFEHVVDPGSTDVLEYVQKVMPGGADVVFTGADTIDLACSLVRDGGTLSASDSGTWNCRSPEPALLAQQNLEPGTDYPRMVRPAPMRSYTHHHERWRGGQLRHCYDICVQLAERGRLDLESYYDLIPVAELERMESVFPDYYEKHFRVGLTSA